MTTPNYDMDTKEGMFNCLVWQTKIVNMIGDGGKWIVPRSNAIYTVYPSKHEVIRKIPDESVDRVFIEMGWTIKEKL